MKTKVGIIGISGITGVELFKILNLHKRVNIVLLADEPVGDKNLNEIILDNSIDISSYKIFKTFSEETFIKCCNDTEILFLCLPSSISMLVVKEIYDCVVNKNFLQPKIIDLSADFRIKNISLYEKFYKQQHLLPELVKKFVYGLPELYREKIKNATFIANPGCYPTTVILGLAPIIRLAEEIIIDAKSGYSGGGRKLVEEYESYGGDNTYPYNANGGHRHIPEIEEQLSLLAENKKQIMFTPYVVSQYRGMLTGIYVKLNFSQIKLSEIEEIYKKYYEKHYFIKILPAGELPQVRNVVNTNFCEIGFAFQENFSNWIKIFVAIDNLIKGAAGQAVQNMNLMCGYEETEGLI